MHFPSLSFPAFIVLSISSRLAHSIIPGLGDASPITIPDDSAERNHLVRVGNGDLFVFNPDTLSAKAGDSVLFAISDPTSHTVSQSRGLERPCTVSEPAFSSSLGNVTFSIQVNDTSPIFVHCEQHCSEGMVMIINPSRSSDIETMVRIAKEEPQSSGALSHGASDQGPTRPAQGPSPSYRPTYRPQGPAPGQGKAPTLIKSAPKFSESSTPAFTVPKATQPVTRGSSPDASSAPGGSSTGRPRKRMRRDAAVAVATALALGAATVAGACCMWRRRRKRRASAPEREDGEPALTPFGNHQSDAYPPERKRIFLKTAPKEDDGPGEVTPFEQPAASDAVSRLGQHGPFGSGDSKPISPGGSGDGENAIGQGQVAVEPTPTVTFLRADLDRVLAENAMLRQTAEPPAYSDGARSELGAQN